VTLERDVLAKQYKTKCNALWAGADSFTFTNPNVRIENGIAVCALLAAILLDI